MIRPGPWGPIYSSANSFASPQYQSLLIRSDLQLGELQTFVNASLQETTTLLVYTSTNLSSVPKYHFVQSNQEPC